MTTMPMFPLGTVTLPGSVLPLHVFEPRYQALVRECVATPPHEFGVVLIERGSEVGGGDQRLWVGTAMRIVQIAELGAGRFAMVSVGVRRLRVVEWLVDDPFPRAEVEDWPDEDLALEGLSHTMAAVAGRVRRAAALAIELGDPVGRADYTVSDDPVLGSYQLAALAPVGDADRYRLLVAATVAARLDLLAEQLDDVEALQQLRLAASQPPLDDGESDPRG